MTVKNDRVPLKDLNLSDRFLFDEVMEDPQAHQDVLSIIFGKKASEEVGVKYMQAWEERYYEKEEAREEEREYSIKVLLESFLEFGVDRDSACQKIMEKYGLNQEAVEKYMNQYWKITS